MSTGVPRPIRAIIGVIALVALLFTVNGWYRDYRGESPSSNGSVEATVTPDPDASESDGDAAEDASDNDEGTEAEQNGGVVVVTIEGLNFRQEPSTSAGLIRGLGRNDRLTYLDTVNGWYHVRDGDGVEGYVSANPQYTELQE